MDQKQVSTWGPAKAIWSCFSWSKNAVFTFATTIVYAVRASVVSQSALQPQKSKNWTFGVFLPKVILLIITKNTNQMHHIISESDGLDKEWRAGITLFLSNILGEFGVV